MSKSDANVGKALQRIELIDDRQVQLLWRRARRTAVRASLVNKSCTASRPVGAGLGCLLPLNRNIL